MGYIQGTSGFTCVGNLTITWTAIGREYLMGKKPRSNSRIQYFSLSDNDINYISAIKPTFNFIPNITGKEDTCLIPTYKNQVRYPIVVEGSENNIIDYRSKPLKTCDSKPIDCADYYDIRPLYTSDSRTNESLQVIWDCIIGQFEGTL